MLLKLTDQAINRAARECATDRKRRELADQGCPGLRIRLTPAGAKTWILGARDQMGRIRRFPLGGYPAMGIAEAREAARATRHEVRQQGADPIAERRRLRSVARAAKAGVGTLRALLDTYGAGPGKELRSWSASRPRVEVVFRPLLDRPLDALTLMDLQLQADAYPSASSRGFAVRTLRPVLKWAAHPGRRHASPELAQISAPSGVRPRERVLSAPELKALLPVLRSSKRPHAAIMRFLLLTLARREEAAEARWADIDLEKAVWTIPVTKNGKPHEVPLSRQAVALLTSLGVGGPAELVFRVRTGAKLGNWDRETKRLQHNSGTSNWTRHDLRRTGATMLGNDGIIPDIIEAGLNHRTIHSALAATYNKARYFPQVQVALQSLADQLDEIENGAADTPVKVGEAGVDGGIDRHPPQPA